MADYGLRTMLRGIGLIEFGTFGESKAIDETALDGTASRVVIADASLLFQGTYARQHSDLIISGPGETVVRLLGYFDVEHPSDLYSSSGAVLTSDVVIRLAGTQNPNVFAQAGVPAGQLPIGQVETLEGAAFSTRANGQRVPLNVGDPVFEDDLIETADDSILGITFVDETVFSLSNNARMILDELVYEVNGTDNSMVMNLVQGTFVFVTGQVAPTGEMLVETPVATMGIRGTTPIVIIEGQNGDTEFGILKDPDGKVGEYAIYDKITKQVIGRVVDEGTILQLDQVGGDLNTVTVDPTRLAERAEAQSNAYFLYTVARDRFNTQQQNDNSSGDGNVPNSDSSNDPITTESIGDQTSLGSSGLSQFSFSTGTDDSGGAAESTTSGSNNNPTGTGQQQNSGNIQNQGAFVSTNTPPITSDQTFQLSEDVEISKASLPVTDDAGTLVYTITRQPEFGAVFVNADGTFTYISDPIFNVLQQGEAATISFDFQASDGAGAVSNISTVTLQILGANDVPIATEINAGVTNEDAGAVSINLLSTALDPDNGDDLDTLNVAINSSNVTRNIVFGIDNETGALTLDPSQFEDLALTESEILTINYTIVDSSGGSTLNSATLVIEGRDDAPVITSLAQTASVTDVVETAIQDPSQNAGDLQTDGTLTFTDVDGTNSGYSTSVSLSATGTLGNFGAVNDSGLLALFSTIVTNPTASADGTVAWGFTGSEALFDYLNDGERLVLEYMVSVTEANLTSNSQMVTVTVDGVNDAPVISTSAQTATLSEVAETAAEDPKQNAGNLTASGALDFTDVDVSDTGHNANLSLTASGALGSFGASNDAILLALFATTVTNTAALADGTVDWNFAGSEALFDYLSAGESLVLQYSIDVSDEALNTKAQTVTITIDGAEDAPFINGTTVGATAEDGALSANGVMTVSDVDAIDIPAFVAQSGTKGTYGSFSVTAAGQWTYTLDNASAQSLAGGEVVAESFTVIATTADGENAIQTVTVSVAGTEDAPVITGTTTGALIAGGSLSATGKLNASDADAIDSPMFTAQIGTAGIHGSFDIAADGVWTYTLDSASTQNLGDGEVVTETFTVAATTTDGESVNQTVTVTVNGVYEPTSVLLEQWEIVGTDATAASIGTANITTNGTNELTDKGIEQFLGIDPAQNSLDSLSDGDATNGSAIQTTFFLTSSADLEFTYSFTGRDSSEEFNDTFQDISFFTTNGIPTLLHQFTPSAGEISGASFSAKIDAGWNTIGFGAMDVGDSVLGATLSLNDIQIAFNDQAGELFYPDYSLSAVSNDNSNGDLDLSLAELDPVIDAAIMRWEEFGLSAEQVGHLQAVTFEVADLHGDLLGVARGGQIILDQDGAGHGWYIDSSPLDDKEFTEFVSETYLRAGADQDSNNGIDLFTAVLQGFGKELGLDQVDEFGSLGDFLLSELTAGERRLPGDSHVEYATASATDLSVGIAPVAINDGEEGEFLVRPGETIDLLVSELLANDFDPNNEQFDLTEVFSTHGGIATVEQVDGEAVVRFTSDPSAQDGDVGGFHYEIANTSGGVGFASVDILVDDLLPTG